MGERCMFSRLGPVRDNAFFERDPGTVCGATKEQVHTSHGVWLLCAVHDRAPHYRPPFTA